MFIDRGSQHEDICPAGTSRQLIKILLAYSDRLVRMPLNTVTFFDKDSHSDMT
jgi:hypothetical protein